MPTRRPAPSEAFSPRLEEGILPAMLRFSQDPKVAEEQMKAIIFYLTTFGYIDGDFDESEKTFVRDYIRGLVHQRVVTGMPDAEPALHQELEERFTTHFHEVFETIDAQVQDLFTEAVSHDEDQDAFIHGKLKLRCFEIFQGFDRDNQELLVQAMDALIEADGQVHPAEAKFRSELLALFESDQGLELLELADGGRTTISPERHRPVAKAPHPFFDQFEHHYSADHERIQKQIEADEALLDRAIAIFEAQAEKGKGKLAGKQRVDELADEAPFLDGHIWVHPTPPGARFDISVLGDLHGCYSCLKGAVMQAQFLESVAAYKKDPNGHPKPFLVLLGDYIDRGLFSLNGVLRSVLQLFVAAPDHVYVLRGNHEFYLEYQGQIYGGVKPAEAINTLKPHLPVEVFRHYMRLFDAMPNILLFGDTVFVHGGIPRDLLLKERYRDLSSLEDADLRFQMMWSDPSSVDVIPASLQEQSARFPFGRLQAAAFLRRMGCHTMVRGHEKVEEGFRVNYDDDDVKLVTLFSAGGQDNEDLPDNSSYRSVTPRALTVTIDDDGTKMTPWAIDYRTFNDPEHNGFFRTEPEIEHRAG